MLSRQCTRVWEPSRRWPRRSSPLSKSIQTAGRRWCNLRRGKDFQPVFRIILVRIRIRGSIPLTNGSGSFSFRQWPSRCQQKYLLKFFVCYFLKVHLHHSSQNKSIKKSQNNRNHGFSYYFCLMIEGSESGSVSLTNGSGSGGMKTSGSWTLLQNVSVPK